MARAALKSNDSSKDAIALLKSDHRQVEHLFERFEEGDDDELDSLAERVCQFLTIHAQIEEEILYPAAKQAFEEDEEDMDLVNEALVEHGSAKELIAKIEAMTSADESFKATVKVLSEYINHHVKEEEKELFPKLKQTELDLQELGTQLGDRKLLLMEEMGVDAEEQPLARGRSKQQGSPRRAGASGSRRTASKARTSGRSARH